MRSIFWWANVIGIIFSGTGAFILAYDVFSFRPKYSIGTWGHICYEKPEHEKKNLNLIKAAMILIPLEGYKKSEKFLNINMGCS